MKHFSPLFYSLWPMALKINLLLLKPLWKEPFLFLLHKIVYICFDFCLKLCFFVVGTSKVENLDEKYTPHFWIALNGRWKHLCKHKLVVQLAIYTLKWVSILYLLLQIPMCCFIQGLKLTEFCHLSQMQ